MIRIIFFLFVPGWMIVTANAAHSQSSRIHLNITPYLEIQNYNWAEIQDAGEDFVNESGYRYSAGLLPQIHLLSGNRLLFEADLRTTLGSVAYDGLLLEPGGGRTPYQTKTAYSGFDGTFYAGYLLNLNKKFGVRPMAGAGLEYWRRNLDDGGPFGYTENYKTAFAVAGIRAEYSPSRHAVLSASGIIRKPMSTSITIPTLVQAGFEASELNLTLPNNPAYHFEAGVQLHRFTFLINYHSWNLGKSGSDHGFYLPNTDRTLAGLKIGYSIPVIQK